MKSFGKNFIFNFLLIASASSQDADSIASELLEQEALSSSSVVKRNEIVRKQQLYLQLKIQLSNLTKKLDAGVTDQVSDDLLAIRNNIDVIGSSSESVLELSRSTAKLEQRYIDLQLEKIMSQVNSAKSPAHFQEANSLLDRAIELDPDNEKKYIARKKEIESLQRDYEFTSSVNEDAIVDEVDSVEEEVSIYLEKARIHHEIGEYLEAMSLLDKILTLDPFNLNASHMKFQISKLIRSRGHDRQASLAKELSAENVWKWVDPIVKSSNKANLLVSSVERDDFNFGEIYRKLEIEIPVVNFDGEPLTEVIDELIQISREQDVEGKGVNIVFLQNQIAQPNNISDGSLDDSADDGFDDGFDDTGFEDTGFEEEATVNESAPVQSKTYPVRLNVEKIPMGKLLELIVQSQGLNLKIEDHMVIIAEPEVQLDLMETKFFNVPAGMLEIIPNSDDLAVGDDAGGNGGQNWQNYFKNMGVTFPGGAKLSFVTSVNRLVVTNTVANNQLIQEIIDNLNTGSAQVNVEAKVVDISWNAMQELGFLWRWTGPQEGIPFDQHRLTGDRIFGQENTGTATAARFDNDIRGINEIVTSNEGPVQLAADLIFGNQELQMMIRALDQSDTTEILMAPNVLAKSGETAVIRVVETRQFVEEWEEGEFNNSEEIVPNTPQFGEERDIGFVLSVTPEVDQ